MYRHCLTNIILKRLDGIHRAVAVELSAKNLSNTTGIHFVLLVLFFFDRFVPEMVHFGLGPVETGTDVVSC